NINAQAASRRRSTASGENANSRTPTASASTCSQSGARAASPWMSPTDCRRFMPSAGAATLLRPALANYAVARAAVAQHFHREAQLLIFRELAEHDLLLPLLDEYVGRDARLVDGRSRGRVIARGRQLDRMPVRSRHDRLHRPLAIGALSDQRGATVNHKRPGADPT